jgi:hypothetical protein
MVDHVCMVGSTLQAFDWLVVPGKRVQDSKS